MLHIPKPKQGDYAAYAQIYIDRVADTSEVSIEQQLVTSLAAVLDFCRHLPPELHTFRYAEGKWSVKEVLQHLIDVERVFAYRALRFSRKDTTPLTGFDQDDYVLHAHADRRDIDALLFELEIVRKATLCLFESLEADSLEVRGTASNYETTTAAIPYLIVGHTLHHLAVLHERYFPDKEA